MRLDEYPVMGYVEDKSGAAVPLLDVPMMTDERFQELAGQLAEQHFREIVGRNPVSRQEAFSWQRARIAERGLNE